MVLSWIRASSVRNGWVVSGSRERKEELGLSIPSSSASRGMGEHELAGADHDVVCERGDQDLLHAQDAAGPRAREGGDQ
jgi:hypothetical protein